jgi:hypothetical protein
LQRNEHQDARGGNEPRGPRLCSAGL